MSSCWRGGGREKGGGQGRRKRAVGGRRAGAPQHSPPGAQNLTLAEAPTPSQNGSSDPTQLRRCGGSSCPRWQASSHPQAMGCRSPGWACVSRLPLAGPWRVSLRNEAGVQRRPAESLTRGGGGTPLLCREAASSPTPAPAAVRGQAPWPGPGWSHAARGRGPHSALASSPCERTVGALVGTTPDTAHVGTVPGPRHCLPSRDKMG